MRTVCLAWVCLAWAAAAWAGPTASLSGTVTSGGKPLAGATVFVSRAYPIRGVAYYCPSCYLDCTKSATTDERGHWSIAELDDALKFELLVAARGHVPAYTPVVVSETQASVDMELAARDISALPNDRVVVGRVLGPRGQPVSGAVVSPQMVYDSNGGGIGGMVNGLDALAVTDADGRFALAYDKPVASMDLKVSAQALATRCFPSLASRGTVHDLRLTEGASVVGGLMRDGRPVSGIEITLALVERTFGAGCFERQTIATGENGQFLFANVLAQGRYVLSASGQQLVDTGCTTPKTIEVAEDGVEVKAGDLEIIAGVRVAGRVLATPGGRLPDGAKISLSNELAWGGVTVDLSENGQFQFPHAAPGQYCLSVHAPGVFVSARNLSVDRLNANMLVGRVDAEITNLLIETSTTAPTPPPRPGQSVPVEIGGVESGAAGGGR